jgi:tetratricopeptide (TPR) repeat protein
MKRLAGTALTIAGAAMLTLTAVAIVIAVRSTGDHSGPTPARVDRSADPSAVTNEVIAFFQQRVERDPVDFVSHTKLGEAYLRQARETGDLSAYQRADAAFRQALAIQPDDPLALAGLGSVLFAQHDFAGALALAEQLYAADPGATQALATIGDANLALGNYAAARQAYATLSNVASGPAVLSRQSHLAELRGDVDRAIDLMEQAEEAAARRGRSAEAIAFYRLQLGALHFNSGRYDDAELWYRAALYVFPGYYPAFAGLGDVAVARGRFGEAIARYQQSVAVVPQPAVLAKLGDVYARTGDQRAAQQQYDTVEFIGRLAAINRTVYNRELALFYADHDIKIADAVRLALAELDTRRDVYGYDAAAWALYKDGRAAEAQPLMAQALQLGTQDARLLFHAGMVARELGDSAAARDYLDRALQINPRFSVLYEPQARRVLAELSDAAGLAEAER